MTATAAAELESLHPSLWRASQLARGRVRTVDTGHAALSNQLPGGGWPVGSLVDLLTQQNGIGELRLLAPALAKVAKSGVVLLQPPHVPQAISLAALGVPPSSALWISPKTGADALWAAEQVLKSGCCGALLYWPGPAGPSARQQHVRGDSLRRLHLAAQSSETLFFMVRPLAAEIDASPAPLRLSVRPAPGGVSIGFVKRQGPQRDDELFLPLPISTTRVQPRRNQVPAQPIVQPMTARDPALATLR